MRYINTTKNKGFTLVELIVVIVILAILAAILVPQLLGYIDRSKQQSALLDCEYIVKALKSECATAYAKGELTVVSGGSKTSFKDGTHFPSISAMSKLLDDKRFGSVGNDYYCCEDVIVNGFGNKQGSAPAVASKKHFCALISKRAEIMKLEFCDGSYKVSYTPETGYVLEQSNCTKGDITYSYVCINDESKAKNPGSKAYDMIVNGIFYQGANKWQVKP